MKRVILATLLLLGTATAPKNDLVTDVIYCNDEDPLENLTEETLPLVNSSTLIWHNTTPLPLSTLVSSSPGIGGSFTPSAFANVSTVTMQLGSSEPPQSATKTLKPTERIPAVPSQSPFSDVLPAVTSPAGLPEATGSSAHTGSQAALKSSASFPLSSSLTSITTTTHYKETNGTSSPQQTGRSGELEYGKTESGAPHTKEQAHGKTHPPTSDFNVLPISAISTGDVNEENEIGNDLTDGIENHNTDNASSTPTYNGTSYTDEKVGLGTAILALIIGQIAVSTSFPTVSQILKGCLTVGLTIRNNRAVWDRMCNSRSAITWLYATAFAVTAHPGAHAAFTAACPKIPWPANVGGVVVHSLAVAALLCNLVESVNVVSVLRGTSRNQWTEDLWQYKPIMLMVWVTAAFFGAYFGLVSTPEPAHVLNSTNLGSLSTPFGIGQNAAIVEMSIGVVSAVMVLVAAISYSRDEYKQNALHEYIATAEKKQAEFVREGVRSRFLAPFSSLLMALNYVLAAYAIETGDFFVALIAFLVSCSGGGVGLFNALFSISFFSCLPCQCCKKHVYNEEEAVGGEAEQNENAHQEQ